MEYQLLKPKQTDSQAFGNVQNGAYTPLFGDTALVKTISAIAVENTTDQTVQFAHGDVGNENVIPERVGPGVAKIIAWDVPHGDKIGITASTANCTSGEVVVTVLG